MGVKASDPEPFGTSPWANVASCRHSMETVEHLLRQIGKGAALAEAIQAMRGSKTLRCIKKLQIAAKVIGRFRASSLKAVPSKEDEDFEVVITLSEQLANHLDECDGSAIIVRSIDTVLDLKRMLFSRFLVPLASQKLLLGEAILNNDDTVEVSQIKPGAHLELDSDEPIRFPLTLDAASLCPVSPMFCSAMQVQESCLSWQIDQLTAESLGFNGALSAKLSPMKRVHLDIDSKFIVGIPFEAEFSAWSYAVENLNASSSLDTADSYFANMGGSVFFNGTKTAIVGAASRPAQGDHLTFSEGIPWGRTWTAPLIKTGRFHKVMDPKMREAGTLYYAWLGENEEVGDDNVENGQRRLICPNMGGFVYLFSPTGEDIDCPPSDDMPAVYFEASGGGYQDRDLDMGILSSESQVMRVPPRERGQLSCCCITTSRQCSMLCDFLECCTNSR